MSPSSTVGSPPEVGVLVPAAGRGERAGPGDLKQFRAIGGVPMLLRAIRPFAQHPRVREIIVALPPEAAASPPSWLRELAGQRLRVVPGGATRASSVAACLAALSHGCTIVLVHDAARPFVAPETVDAVMAVAAGGAGAVAAVPVSDTLKQADERGERVRQTLDRRHLWRAQTPQGFPRAMLEAAYARLAELGDPTDDAQLVEQAGFPVRVVPDRTTNIKITTPDDFALAEALASR